MPWPEGLGEEPIYLFWDLGRRLSSSLWLELKMTEQLWLGSLLRKLILELGSEKCLHWVWSQVEDSDTDGLFLFSLLFLLVFWGGFLRNCVQLVQVIIMKIPGISGAIPATIIQPSHVQHVRETCSLEHPLRCQYFTFFIFIHSLYFILHTLFVFYFTHIELKTQ